MRLFLCNLKLKKSSNLFLSKYSYWPNPAKIWIVSNLTVSRLERQRAVLHTEIPNIKPMYY